MVAKTGKSESFVTIFDDTYNQPDCRMNGRMMLELGYRHHDHAAPIFAAAVKLLKNVRSLPNANILDFASGYGFVTCLMKYGVTLQTCLSRYLDPALDTLSSHEAALRDMAWLSQLSPRFPNDRFVGLDVCQNAVNYGHKIGLFDEVFAEDIQAQTPSKELKACLAETDIIVECGSVAHLMPLALDRILEAKRGSKPWIITSPVRGNERALAFEILGDHGMIVEPIGDPFPHRRFSSDEEHDLALSIARAAGHKTEKLEESGYFFAQVYLARPPEDAKTLDLSSLAQSYAN